MPQTPMKDPDDLVEKLEALVVAVPVISVLFSTLIGFNVGQLATLMVKPFSRNAFRKLNRWGADTWWGWCASASKALHGSRIQVTGDDLPMRENVVCFSNHQQMADIPFLMMLARSKDRLGDMKWIVKKELKHVPGVGWGMSFLDCVYVDRSWTSDEEHIMNTFATLRDEHVPVWLMIFPEGTRIQAQKIKASQEYARKGGLFEPRHVLLPRTKGFSAAVQGLRGHITAIYDVTIGYKEGVPSLWQFIQGFGDEAHLHVKRFPVDGVPSSTEDLSNWLIERYKEKDALLDRFYAKGSFA